MRSPPVNMIKLNEGSVGRDLYGATSVSAASTNKIELFGSATISYLARFQSWSLGHGIDRKKILSSPQKDQSRSVDGNRRGFRSQEVFGVGYLRGRRENQVEDPTFIRPVFHLKLSRTDQVRR